MARVTFTQNNQTQTFGNDSEEQGFNYTLTSQLNSAMRVKFAGSNQRSYGGSTLPAKEARRHEHRQSDALPESAPHEMA